MIIRDLSLVLQKLENTTSRLTITEQLAELFRSATPREAQEICYLLQGRVVPLYEPVEFGVADKFMIRAIVLAYGQSEAAVLSRFRKYGDLGAAAEESHAGVRKELLSVHEVFTALTHLAQTGGVGSQEKKIGLLAALLSSVDALSARYIARIPLGKLRLGFSEMTILDALSWMLVGDKSLRAKLEGAYNIRADIGFIAFAVKEHGIKGLSHVKVRVGTPILAALCQRLTGASEMIEKMGTVAVEPKYDGVRVQIHYKPSGVKTFSRNLENTTDMFAELLDLGDAISAREVILDAEAVGFDPKTGKIISFQATVTRKRKHDIQTVMLTVPLKFFVFDILYKDGTDLLHTPLSERRTILRETLKKGPLLTLSPQIVTSEVEELREFHEKKRAEGLEGVVVKKWNSSYEPGRRGYNWVKFKESDGQTGKLADTVDAVVMGYYRGEGKRAGFGIGAFLVGVRSGENVVTVTKVGTGVSDELWGQLHTKLETIKAESAPRAYTKVHKTLLPDVWVEPQVVVEIAADDITKSSTHTAGFALRFPRLVKIRTDKSPRDATTVEELEDMFRRQ